MNVACSNVARIVDVLTETQNSVRRPELGGAGEAPPAHLKINHSYRNTSSHSTPPHTSFYTHSFFMTTLGIARKCNHTTNW